MKLCSAIVYVSWCVIICICGSYCILLAQLTCMMLTALPASLLW